MSKSPRRRMTRFVLTPRQQAWHAPRGLSQFEPIVPAQPLVRQPGPVPPRKLLVGVLRPRFGAAASTPDEAVLIIHPRFEHR